MSIPRAVQRFVCWTSFGGNHSTALRVDTHNRLALVCKTVRIYRNRFVNHNTQHSVFYMPQRAVISEMQCKVRDKKRLPIKRKPIKK